VLVLSCGVCGGGRLISSPPPPPPPAPPSFFVSARGKNTFFDALVATAVQHPIVLLGTWEMGGSSRLLGIMLYFILETDTRSRARATSKSTVNLARN